MYSDYKFKFKQLLESQSSCLQRQPKITLEQEGFTLTGLYLINFFAIEIDLDV